MEARDGDLFYFLKLHVSAFLIEMTHVLTYCYATKRLPEGGGVNALLPGRG